MRLILKRNQAEKKGLLGGSKGIHFSLSFRVEMTPEETELLDRYSATHEQIATMGFVAEAEALGHLKVIDGVKTGGILTVSDLMKGRIFQTKSVGTLLDAENEIKEGCAALKIFLEVMQSFGGEEVIKY